MKRLPFTSLTPKGGFQSFLLGMPRAVSTLPLILPPTPVISLSPFLSTPLTMHLEDDLLFSYLSVYISTEYCT